MADEREGYKEPGEEPLTPWASSAETTPTHQWDSVNDVTPEIITEFSRPGANVESDLLSTDDVNNIDQVLDCLPIDNSNALHPEDLAIIQGRRREARESIAREWHNLECQEDPLAEAVYEELRSSHTEHIESSGQQTQQSVETENQTPPQSKKRKNGDNHPSEKKSRRDDSCGGD